MVKPKVKVKKVKTMTANTRKSIKKMYDKMDKKAIHPISEVLDTQWKNYLEKNKNFGKFDEHSDWRLKEVHHDIAKIRKSLYDLSLNVEGEHDHISKSVQRCHDRIEHVEGLILGLSDKVEQLNEATLNLNLIIENLVAKIIATKRKHTPHTPYDPKQQDWRRGSAVFGAKERADAEKRIRDALKGLDRSPHWNPKHPDHLPPDDFKKQLDEMSDDDDTYDKRQRGIDSFKSSDPNEDLR